MAERITVPAPTPDEEMRQLAEVVARLHYTVEIIVENAKEFLPGESVDEVEAAWRSTGPKIAGLVEGIFPERGSNPPPEPPLFQKMKEAELVAEASRLKKSTLNRGIDRFFSFWFSEPRTDEKRIKAAEAAEDVAELGSTLFGSIPGHEYAAEFCSVLGHLIGVRLKRGY